MLEILLKLIYPDVCGICNQLNRAGICKNCKLKLEELDITRIRKYTNQNFKEHMYIYKYDREIRNILLDYKFNNKSYLYKTFAELIEENNKVIEYIKKFDIITSVPLHKKRLRERGYNQCELILNKLRRDLKELNIDNKILIKIKNTKIQSTLNKKERMENIKDAYILNKKKDIKNKRVLLFDDVYTTGSTVNECAKVLLEHGATEIGILTFSKD